MDLIVFFWLFSLLVSPASAQTCTITAPTGSVSNFAPSSPTVYFGAYSPTPYPQTAYIFASNNGTVTIGGSTGTIAIGPPAGAYPTPMPTVLINGINPTSWSDFTGTIAPAGGAVGTTGRVSWTWPANTNSRATPTTNAYLSNCSPKPAPSPTGPLIRGSNDCVTLPLTGYWHITGSVTIATGSGGTVFSLYYTNAGTGDDLLMGSSWTSNNAGFIPFSLTRKITSAPSTFYINTNCGNTACYSISPYISNLHVEYKGPL